MNEAPDSDFELPISQSHDPLDLLLRTRLLDPPTHPSLLACLDHYEILDWIGSGGMGIVFLARSSRKIPPKDEAADLLDLPDEEEEREEATGSVPQPEPIQDLVAIKLLRPELISNTEAVDRFLQEARHMQKLFHPNLLPVMEVCDRPNKSPARPSSMPVFRSRRPFFVMPYLEQGNLARRIRSMGPLPQKLILEIARQIASALSHVHGKGIVHRDLKPGNILLGKADHVFLADFGLARTFTNESVTNVRQSHCVGTSSYLSPALAAGEAEDTRGDIYAFGAILYEMLSGRAPYPETTPGETIQRILLGPPEPIRHFNPAASEELVFVAEGAMARKTRDRYASMTDVVADLERIAHGEAPHGPHGQDKARMAGAQEEIRSRGISSSGWMIIALLAISLASLSFWLSTERLNVVGQYELPGILHWENSRLVEWNGHPPQELMLVQQDELVVLSDMGPLVRQAVLQAAFGQPFFIDFTWDINGDRIDEIFVEWADRESMHLSVINHQFRLLKNLQFKAENRKLDAQAPISSRLRTESVLDIDRDGQRELLATVHSDLKGCWCGVVCFNFEDSAVRWSYPTTGNPETVQLADLDRDGRSEILVSIPRDNLSTGSSAAQGPILALTSQGRLMWEALGEATEQTLRLLGTNLSPFKEPQIFVWSPPLREKEFSPSSSPNLYSLNHRGGLIARFEADAPLTGAILWPFPQKDQPLLILTDAIGQVYQLAEKFTVQRKRKLIDGGEGWLRVAAISDLNSDGRDEIVLTVQGRPGRAYLSPASIIVLNSRLEMVARYEMPKSFGGEFAPAVLVTDWDGNREMELLVLGEEVVVMKLGKGR